MNIKAKPFLKWPGGKTQLSKRINLINLNANKVA